MPPEIKTGGCGGASARGLGYDRPAMTTTLLQRGLARARALEAENRWPEAAHVYGQLRRSAPDWATARRFRGEFLLRQGQYREGFAEFEYRLAEPVFATAARTAPAWTGDDPAGRRLLVAAEQGRGDLIMLARFLPALAAAGAQVSFGVQADLARLFRSLGSQVAVIAEGDPLPVHDGHAWAFSLPYLLGVTQESVPHAPYLTAEPDLMAAWAARLGGDGPVVGRCWQGNPSFARDGARSVPAAALAPLLAVPGLRFVGLAAAGDAQALTATAGCFTNLGPEIIAAPQGFAITAAILANLDLVITVDTAIAHLAGALGRPAWLMLPFLADWRWGTDGSSSPWYPSLRLFRAPQPGGAVLALPDVAAALAAWR